MLRVTRPANAQIVEMVTARGCFADTSALSNSFKVAFHLSTRYLTA
jgi:hypothetical protein